VIRVEAERKAAQAQKKADRKAAVFGKRKLGRQVKCKKAQVVNGVIQSSSEGLTASEYEVDTGAQSSVNLEGVIEEPEAAQSKECRIFTPEWEGTPRKKSKKSNSIPVSAKATTTKKGKGKKALLLEVPITESLHHTLKRSRDGEKCMC
jgi:hypothetical protein